MLSSPSLLALLRRLRTRGARPQGRAVAPGVLLDSVMLDRRFDDIVRQLKASGEFLES